MATPILLFDVNETLLDMRALDPAFARAFGAAGVRRHWFLTLQQLWMTATLTDDYQPFDRLAAAALDIVAAQQQRELDRENRSAILVGLTSLPPHADARGALAVLRAAGVRLAALTNGTSKGARKQLRHAGLAEYFELILSVDQVQRYKPAPEPYLFAARQMDVRPAQAFLVAAHTWDLAGAHAAGLGTIFVRRAGTALNPAGPKPDIEVQDLSELARNIAGRRRGTPAKRPLRRRA